MKFTSFIEMPLWQKAHRLVLDIYGLSASFPKEEVYGLTSQMRRSALSVSGNIAEAFGRFHYLDKSNFYFNARGSLEETRNYLIVSEDLGYTTPEAAHTIMDNINAISEELNTVVKSLRLRTQRKSQSQSKSQSKSKSKSE
jgi:four helix bundle protein